MRQAAILVICVLLTLGCGGRSGHTTARPKPAAVEPAATTPTAATRPAVARKPVLPRATRAASRRPDTPKPPRLTVAHDDADLGAATSSPLDGLESLAKEAARRPAPAREPADEPPTTDRWRVVSVHDGDTVLCLDDDDTQHKVRLVGIDAPEIGQPFGTVSRDELRALVLRKSVTVHQHGEDRYGRTLGTLEIDGTDVARRMVAAGLAWHFARYSDDERLAAAEREARDARRGLWADRDPVPPWEWRATERDRKAAKGDAAAR